MENNTFNVQKKMEALQKGLNGDVKNGLEIIDFMKNDLLSPDQKKMVDEKLAEANITGKLKEFNKSMNTAASKINL